MAARILIVGGAGFIGSHLAAHCLERGEEVHVIVRETSALGRLDGLDGLAIHKIGLDSEAALIECLNAVRPEQIFYLAVETRRGGSPLDIAAASVEQDLLNYLRMLKAVCSAEAPPKMFIRAGSLAEYGAAEAPYRESQLERPLTPYAAGLVAGTQYTRMLQPHLPFPVVTARLALTYGPDQSEDFLVAHLIEQCLANAPSTVRNPAARRDLLHVDDAVAALYKLGSAPLAGGVVLNIATGIAPSNFETARLIIKATDADPGLLSFGDGAGEDGADDFRGSTELAKLLLDWSADIMLPEGIERTVADIRGRRRLRPVEAR